MRNRYLTAVPVVLVIIGLAFCLCGKGGGEKAVRLLVSIPPITPEQIEKDVIDQDDSKQSLANWQNYVGKVVSWSGIVLEPNEYELMAAKRNFSYNERILVVVQVKSLRVQMPSEKPFNAGTKVEFTATLNGFAGGSSRRIVVNREGLEVKSINK